MASTCATWDNWLLLLHKRHCDYLFAALQPLQCTRFDSSCRNTVDLKLPITPGRQYSPATTCSHAHTLHCSRTHIHRRLKTEPQHWRGKSADGVHHYTGLSC
eukprot:2194-Heterococcus_DN1.PRE.1